MGSLLPFQKNRQRLSEEAFNRFTRDIGPQLTKLIDDLVKIEADGAELTKEQELDVASRAAFSVAGISTATVFHRSKLITMREGIDAAADGVMCLHNVAEFADGQRAE